MKKVIVLIPIYRFDLSKDEIYSLNRCLDILRSYEIGIIAPYSLELTRIVNGQRLPIYRFHDSFFEGISGYNRLMLSREFYLRYVDYQYILIYQLDAIVFLNSLEKFIRLDYDYIGAPWIHGIKFMAKSYSTIVGRCVSSLYNMLHRIVYEDVLYVGNGGFSLRKVSSFIDVLDKFQKLSGEYRGNEDLFFSWVGRNYPQIFNVAPMEVALQFSFETLPRECYNLNGNKMPFGCHAWNKYDANFIELLLNEAKNKKGAL